MNSLQEQLCLNRPNFQINPKQSFDDARLYFGRDQDQKIAQDIQTGYMAGYVPRIYMFGNYGTGKTHLLYHLKHQFAQGDTAVKIAPYVVQIEAETRTRYQALHKRLLDAVGIEALEKAYLDYGFASGGERERRFRELFEDPNVYQVMQLLPTGTANKILAWRWLTGERLSPAEQKDLGVTSVLTETGDLVQLLVTVGQLFKRTGQNLLFLIDEAEGLHNVSNEDAQGSWHDAFRRLSDPNDNQSVGWILAFYETLHNDAPKFMMLADITTRLGKGGQVRLDPMKPVEVRAFLLDLLKAFVDRKCVEMLISSPNTKTTVDFYPFTESGLKAFIEHSGAAPEKAIPRTILSALTSCALEALRRNTRIFDADLVNDVVPAEFVD
jgi:hypothetical protein